MLTLTFVQTNHRCHFGIGQREVKDIQVTLDPIGMYLLRKDDNAQLIFKAQDNLAGILAVLCC